jgi:TDG/mug DNA glycosylase family protein
VDRDTIGVDEVRADWVDAGIPTADLPIAFAELHRSLRVGGRFTVALAVDERPDATGTAPADRIRTLVEAAGFRIDESAVVESDGNFGRIEITATAMRAIPDHVDGAMRMLCCGLNPSLHAADAGVGYVTGSNRFWTAMARAGLSTRDRDPRHLLRHDHIGMTDLVKRPTARADELSKEEYVAGVDRLRRLCEWLRPASLAVVGLAGWRAAVDRRATVGWQDEPLGPTPVYVLPSTSGLNAGTSLDDLVDHLRRAAGGR